MRDRIQEGCLQDSARASVSEHWQLKYTFSMHLYKSLQCICAWASQIKYNRPFCMQTAFGRVFTAKIASKIPAKCIYSGPIFSADQFGRDNVHAL